MTVPAKRVAALYDIHGNLPGLEAALAEIAREEVDQIVVGGDVVLGPMPRETLARLRAVEIPMQFLAGNCDRVMLEHIVGEARQSKETPDPFRQNILWVAQQLGPEDRQWVAQWPKTVSVTIDGLGSVLFCHATPRNDTEVFTRRTPEDRVRPILEGVDAAVVVCGHTHMQFDRTIGQTRVVNAGSVGVPYGAPGAHWLLLGPGVEHRRTPYDLARAAALVRATSYPPAEEFAARNILAPPSEDEILERLAGMELK